MQTTPLAQPFQEPTTPPHENTSSDDIADGHQQRGASSATSAYQNDIPSAIRLAPPASSAQAGCIVEIRQHSVGTDEYADNTYMYGQDKHENEDDVDNDYRPRLLKRFSTFWPSERELLERRHSLEFLYPAHDCETRKSSPLVAIVGLVATVCGGGVLSLPIAFSKAGIVPSTLLMLFAAIITEFSMYILCSCARRTGGRSYGDCAKKAFGQLAEIGATALLILLLCFVLIAYMVLVKDIATPMVLYVWPDLMAFFARLAGLNAQVDEDAVVDVASRYILMAILLCVSPLLLKRDLHALRHTCYVGMLSALVLLFGVVHRCIERNVFQKGLFREKAVWWGDTDGIMFAFPIIILSFFSIYNVLSVHSALTNPTRRRVKMVLDGTVLSCFSLFYIIGMAGYLYAYDDTTDNILLNFPLNFRLILCGRVGYLFTLCFGLPLITLPCREATLSLPNQLKLWWTSSHSQNESNCDITSKLESGNIDTDAGERMKFLATKQKSFYSRYKATYEDEDSPRRKRNPQENSHSNLSVDYQGQECCPGDSFQHNTSTLGLLLLAYTVGISVPGVAVVWSVVGSSMALFIGFTIPTACYLKIRNRKRLNPRSLSAWLLLIFSIVASFVCTYQTLNRIHSVHPGD